ncbi:Leucine-rich repeat [Trinorchestia longiramus]|nr:Leucine-rich repeat [Trinorchestia longiramus]
MPFKNFFKRKSDPSVLKNTEDKPEEDKHLLTLKCMQSQQTVEPVYDISGCQAAFIPDQTFTYCKLLRKTSLILHSNSFTSLEDGGSLSDLSSLEVLDIHSNHIAQFPSDIALLVNLVQLDASKNRLKSLPNSFRKLRSLKILDLSENNFSQVPLAICALPRLNKLCLDGNRIKHIPSDFHKLQSSLEHFSISLNPVKDPEGSLLNEHGVEGLMKHLCAKAGVEYTGVSEELQAAEEIDQPQQNVPDSDDVTPVMANYILKKRQEMLDNLLKEKQMEEENDGTFTSILCKREAEKKKILDDLDPFADNLDSVQTKKLEDHNWKIELERKLKEKHDEEIGAYLTQASSKNDKIELLSAHEAAVQSALEGIAGDRSSEHQRLLKDLTDSEQNVTVIMEEIISGAATKNAAFVASLEEQERELERLVSSAAVSHAEVRENEVLQAMQQLLSETLMLEEKVLSSNKNAGWVSELIDTSTHNDLELNEIMSSRQSNLKNWNAILLHDQACQAAAFKLLLLNNDIKRANIISQIQQVEEELVRVSLLELRKQLLSFEGGSMEMLEQRSTLVNLLRKLFKQKKTREDELEDWLSRIEDVHKGDGKEAADFWLVQYQRLMDLKPAGLTEAETQLDENVIKILRASGMLRLQPLFARHKLSLDELLNMTEERARMIGISREMYGALQSAIEDHIAAEKLGLASSDRVPSAPPQKDVDVDDTRAPSAPPLSSHGPSSPPCLPDDSPSSAECQPDASTPSAPSLQQCYLEPDCVVCLERPSCLVLLPCGHVCLCSTCAGPLTECPICRALISTKLIIGSQALHSNELIA